MAKPSRKTGGATEFSAGVYGTTVRVTLTSTTPEERIACLKAIQALDSEATMPTDKTPDKGVIICNVAADTPRRSRTSAAHQLRRDARRIAEATVDRMRNPTAARGSSRSRTPFKRDLRGLKGAFA
jgi:hypothetical protein